MHSFLWQGKDGDGKARGVRIEAENAQAAKALLASQGWTELRLIKCEIADAVRGRREQQVTPDQEVSRFWGNKPSFAGRWAKSLIGSSIALLAFTAIVILGIYKHDTHSVLLGAERLLVLVLLFPVLYLFYSQSRRNYAQLNKAKVDGRWNDVLHCVEKLRRSTRNTRIGVRENELLRNHAVALAHLGRLDEAVAEYRQFENSPQVPHWLYLSHLSGIYHAGAEYEREVELKMQMLAEKPDMAAGWIDLAGLLAKKLKRPAEAREALARAANLEMIPMARPHVLSSEGVILWREGRLPEARLKLEQALVEIKPFAKKPLVEHSILSTKSYLCVVNASLGNESEARALFKEVEKHLMAHHEDELLQIYRAKIPTAR